MISLLALLFACGGDPSYIVEGTVVEVTSADEVVIDHEDVPGLMGAMTMPFHVEDPDLIKNLHPGQRIIARLEIGESGGYLTKIRVTGTRAVPKKLDLGPAPLRVGQQLKRTPVTVEDGSTILIGEGQGKPTILTFLYTTCPMKEFCPATVARFQALQEEIDPSVQLVAVTIDPDTDTLEVLTDFAREFGAKPKLWRFGRVEDLPALAMSAGLTVTEAGKEIAHGIRILVLDADGRLVKRFDHLNWSLDEVLQAARRK